MSKRLAKRSVTVYLQHWFAIGEVITTPFISVSTVTVDNGSKDACNFGGKSHVFSNDDEINKARNIDISIVFSINYGLVVKLCADDQDPYAPSSVLYVAPSNNIVSYCKATLDQYLVSGVTKLLITNGKKNFDRYLSGIEICRQLDSSRRGDSRRNINVIEFNIPLQRLHLTVIPVKQNFL